MKIKLLFFLVAWFALPVLSQTSEWQTLKTDDNEFLMKMPANCYSHFYNKDGLEVGYSSDSYQLKEMRLLQCYEKQTLMSVEAYRTEKPKKAVEFLASSFSFKESGTKLNLGKEFYGVELVEQNNDYSQTVRIVASKTHVYLVLAAKRGVPEATMKQFLDSLKFGANSNENAISLSSLKNIEPELTTAKKDAPAEVDSPSAAPPPNAPLNEPGSKRMIVLSKPRVSYTEAARRNAVAGTIRVKILFGANARVEKVHVVKTLPEGLVRQAVFAALRIKFLPEEKDGEPRSVTKTLEYSFSIY